MLFLTAILALSPQQPSQQKAFEPPAFRALDGFTVELWAESPLLHNPTAIDIDDRGRVWVTEGVRYRRWSGRNPGLEREGDRVVIVSDEDGDGRAETSKIFVEDPDLVSPLGILVLDDVVLVSASPNLYAYYDEDGDDEADRRETLLTGFGGPNHDHGLHSGVVGPDGALYFALGNAGPHIVTGKDGFTLRSGSLYVGGGEVVADNKPGLVSDDGHTWTGGLMLRMQKDGSGLEVLAHNFRNPYEIAVDPYGRMWTADNDDDGNLGCRALWIQPRGDHGFFSSDGTRTWQADKRPGLSTQEAHWHVADPGVAKPGSVYGAGSPTGVAFIADGPLANVLGETLLTCDAGSGTVFAWQPVRDGSGWRLEERRLLEPAREKEDGGAWFRPSDVAVMPDGSVMVADWFDPAVGGHYAGDHSSAGHLYRVVHSGSDPAIGDGVARRARDLWRSAPKNPGLLMVTIENAKDERLREAALNAYARYHRADLPARAKSLGWAKSKHGSVRRTVALSLEGLGLTEVTLELWRDLTAAHVLGDRIGLEAIGSGAHGIEEELWSELALAFGDNPSRWSDSFAEVSWRLHPAAATEAWKARALDPTLSGAQRRQALDALAFTPSQAAAEAMVAAHLLGPADVRDYARYWIEHRDTNDWRAYGLAKELPGVRPEYQSAELLYRSDPVTAGRIAIDVALEGIETLWLVVDEEGNNGHDWADWIDPKVEVNGEWQILKDIDWRVAEAGWGRVRINRNAAGSGPMLVEGQEATGLGTHAPSQIAWALPEGTTRLLAEAGIDDGGSSQPGAQPRVRFEVRGQKGSRSGYGPALAVAFASDRSVEERSKAMRELSLDPSAGMLLVHRAAEGQLSEEERAWVGAHIFNNPDPAVRALGSEQFVRADAPEMPALSELMALTGDPHRGREVFLSDAAQCTRCHVYESHGFRRGVELGPELTAIGKKYGRDGLFDAILNPSAAIAHGYDTWLVETEDGLLYAGFMLADGELVVLKDTNGERHAIPAEEIVFRKQQPTSTMPQGLATDLEPQELADLVAFLPSNSNAGTVFGEWENLLEHSGGGIEGWVVHSSDSSVPDADIWNFEEGVLSTTGQPAGYIRTEAQYTNFQLELEWRFDPVKGAGNSGVLLRLHGEDRVWPNSIEAQLRSTSAGDIWNIGEFPMLAEPSRTRGRHTARALPSNEKPLGEWNHYRITLDHGHLTLEVNGELQNEAAWCAEIPGHIALQSEGAPIEFRKLRLREIH